MEFLCMKGRHKVEMVDGSYQVETITTSKGIRKQARAICPEHNSKMFQYVKK